MRTATQKNDTVNVSIEELEALASKALETGGFLAEEAQMIAKSLVLSDMSGHASHGVNRVREYTKALKEGELVSGVALETTKESPAVLVCDAQFGSGFVQMPRLLNRLIPKAKEMGVASATLINSGHVGRLGEWVEILAAENLVGMVMVQDNGVWYIVAPPGAKEGRISTNPFAFGVPVKDSGAFIFDMSTSVVAAGKLGVATTAGESIPEGWALDSDGQPTTDPSVVFKDPKGTILPVAGYKGFALGMVVDFLTAGLSGGFCPPAEKGAKLTNNIFVTAWDPEMFSGLAHLQTESQKLMDFVRSSASIEPGTEIRLPGDVSGQKRAACRENGIAINKAIYERLNSEY